MTDHEAHVAHLRKVRDQKLSASDFSQLPDVFDEITRGEWAAYRQLLRDFPSTFPEDITSENTPVVPLSPPEQEAVDSTVPVDPPQE